MTVRSSANRAQSGGIFSTMNALVAMGGFAAGALLVGWVAFERSSSGTAESAQIPIPPHAPQPAVELPVTPIQAWHPSAVSGPWNFEAATPEPRGWPGRKRPDLLSAPEGWTYDGLIEAER